MKFDFELIKNRNLQIPTKDKISYYLGVITIIASIIFLLVGLLKIWMFIVLLLVSLFLMRSGLNFPIQWTYAHFLTFIRPIKSMKVKIQLLQPNEIDLEKFPNMKILFVLYLICDFLLQIIGLSVLGFLLYLGYLKFT